MSSFVLIEYNLELSHILQTIVRFSSFLVILYVIQADTACHNIYVLKYIYSLSQKKLMMFVNLIRHSATNVIHRLTDSKVQTHTCIMYEYLPTGYLQVIGFKPSIRNRVLCSGMLLYLHLISNKIHIFSSCKV